VPVIFILHANAHPNVSWPSQPRTDLLEAFRAFCEHLICMLRGILHDLENALDKFQRHLIGYIIADLFLVAFATYMLWGLFFIRWF
jgi:hypothetical protein